MILRIFKVINFPVRNHYWQKSMNTSAFHDVAYIQKQI